MRPITKQITGVGSSSPITFDTFRIPFNVGYGCSVLGTATYTVQHTFDDYNAIDFVWADARWFDNTLLTGVSTAEDGNYAFPITAMRITITSGSGTVSVTAIQA